MAFKDHFSDQAGRYARARPHYPEALFAVLAAQCRQQQLAVDCGAGNGQGTLGLSEHFDRVIAVEPSARQLALLPDHPRIRPLRASAEATGLPDGQADLVCAAQSLHWFDIPRFMAEARRLLRPGRVLAIWCYGDARVPEHPEPLAAFQDALAPYWPAERALVAEGYASVPMPGEALEVVSPPIALAWDREQLIDYLASWSAVRVFRKERGEAALVALYERLRAAWRAGDRRRVVWPVHLRMARL